VVPAPAPATGPAAAPAPAPGNWWDKFSADGFVDAYGNLNYNFPKPQWGNGFPNRAYDQAQGFALNQIGANVSYSSDNVGGTISLRFGPEAAIYNLPAAPPGNGTADDNFGMQNVRQAYATLKADKLTFDLGKWDQPFGSEVPDSQLNFFYTRSLLFQLNQPVFFTGVRFDAAFSDQVDLKLFVANGWNNTIDNNTGKDFGGQLMLKPMDTLVFYIGGVAGPEQSDFLPAPTFVTNPTALGTGAAGTGKIPGADSHWRELVDLVVDFNPTSALSFALNGDFDTESDATGIGTQSETWWGVNLGIKYVVADPFAVAVRGEYFQDNHGLIFPINPASGDTKANVESATLTLSYVAASKLTLMLDNRVDFADSEVYSGTSGPGVSKNLFTTTLGAIIATK
jgi:Putative beta-barrel porin-2, OmpL-like. bbp2